MPSEVLVLLSVFKKNLKSGARAGIAFAEGAFSLVLVRRDADAKPALEYCSTHHVTAAGPGDLTHTLKSQLEKLGASKATMCAVIDGDDYQIVQVEAPDVLPSEMRAAIRWKLRDAISFSVDEASVDIFETPETVRRSETKMLFAVAARESAIQRVSGALKSAARGFNAIDIPELCLRNLGALLPQDAKGVAMLAINETFAQLVVTRQGVMYLTRRIEFSRGGFNPHTKTTAEDIDAGALALELQRSLDYYESHYDQTPIGDLIIAPVTERVQKLAADLKNETSLRIAVLDARELFTVYKPGELITDWQCLMALGAALRTDDASG
jgi:MSHA biogenesis protein MshI